MSDKNIYTYIKQLTDYAERTGLITGDDTVWSRNRLLEILRLQDYEEPADVPQASLEDILRSIDDYAAQNGLIESNSVVYRDLFDTSLMGVFVARPGEINREFYRLYEASPEKATDWFYSLCRNSDYIRTYRVKKDLKWTTESRYGMIDITINLSKPEKDPKAIAAAKSMPQAGYPKCLLCHENEGYAGNVKSPARQNLRQIPIALGDDTWFLQYSPYVYYNEHCIVLSDKHEPMKITRRTFERQLAFVAQFPHYFLGSNADLPIVGGSILTHDHMQGGHYTFAMEKAPVEREIFFNGYPDVCAGIVKWPMSVIRLSSVNREQLVSLADKILSDWRSYSDEAAGIIALTNEPHNTITPIARMRGGRYELDLVLRCNITTQEHPMGVFHPHAELHHIKKENIGLIEVMGLAVLPARLKTEMEHLADCILAGGNPADSEELAKHADWVRSFAGNYTFTSENITGILEQEIGKVFVKVLEDAGVYKCTADGREHFMAFVRAAGGR